jgi:hypothetical protein
MTAVQKLTVVCISWTSAKKNLLKKDNKFTQYPRPGKLLGKYLQNNTFLAKISSLQNISRIRISNSFQYKNNLFLRQCSQK